MSSSEKAETQSRAHWRVVNPVPTIRLGFCILALLNILQDVNYYDYHPHRHTCVYKLLNPSLALLSASVFSSAIVVSLTLVYNSVM